MSAMSNYLEEKLVSWLFRTDATWTKPTHNWVRLYTAAPTDAGGGTEVTGGGYAAVDLPPLDANWTAPAGGNGHTDNAVAITFPTVTGDWSAGASITHFAIWDLQTGGNMLFWGALTNPKTVHNGDPAPSFAIGDLDITFA